MARLTDQGGGKEAQHPAGDTCPDGVGIARAGASRWSLRHHYGGHHHEQRTVRGRHPHLTHSLLTTWPFVKKGNPKGIHSVNDLSRKTCESVC